MKPQVNKGGATKARQRRTRVLKSLNSQLSKGTKVLKNSLGGQEVPLEEADKSRITKEIEILKARI